VAHAACRLQEFESQQRSLQQEQEAAEFEKLQMKFGFSDKVSTAAGLGVCRVVSVRSFLTWLAACTLG
jgi:hypothetical protein